MSIIDKRNMGKNKSINNRQKFIKRYKNVIYKSIHDTTITDATKSKTATINKKDLREPCFNLDTSSGRIKRILPGNRTFKVGDRVNKNKSSVKGEGGGGQQGRELDEFTFVLTKEEFISIYFEDMCLPNFIKKSLKDSYKFKLARSGYSKDGIPPRLDLLKTFKQSLARKIATKSDTRFLDPFDLRYKYYTQKPFPILQAHIFFLMDVSGSMGEFEKTIAKKFFLLLYLFLTKEYEKVTFSFIRHTTEAQECSEEEFFYSTESGGTIISSGLGLINKIIDERLNLNECNIYVAQASDGDNLTSDIVDCAKELLEVIDKVQYFSYIQTENAEVTNWKREYNIEDLYDVYEMVAKENKKLNIKRVHDMAEVFPVLKNLFSSEN